MKSPALSNALPIKIIKRLLVSHNLFVGGRVFFELFLNVFLWKQTGDLQLIAWFNIAYITAHIIFFALFGYVAKRVDVDIPRKVGLAGQIGSYVLIFFLGSAVVDYALLIALLIGAFNGIYWISFNTLRYDFTTIRNRGHYVGLESAARIAVRVAMPVVGGFIIALNIFGYGYGGGFLFGILLFCISFIIGGVKDPVKTNTPFHLWKTYKKVRKNRDAMISMRAYFFSGASRTGALMRVLLPLFIFGILQSELKLGGWISFFSMVAIGVALLLGKYLDYKYYTRFILFGGVIYAALLVLIVVYPSLFTFVLFGTLTEILAVIIAIPKRVISENIIHRLKNHSAHRVEYLVIRDFYNVFLGRGIGYIMLLFVGGLATRGMQTVLLIMAGMVIIEALLLRSIKADLSAL
jgi:MFS transporter, YQGE family, putative transporter